MSEVIDIWGKWWLPDTPEQVVSGHFVFDPITGGTLSLTGSLDEPKPRKSWDDDLGIYDRILGKDEKYIYTLNDCYTVRRGGRPESYQTLEVNSFLKNVHLNKDAALEFDSVTFELRGFNHWIQISGIDEIDNPTIANVTKQPTFVLTATSLEADKCDTHNGFTVAIDQHLYSFSSTYGGTASIEEKRLLTVRSPVRSDLRTFIEVAASVQDLASIALNETAFFDRVTCNNNDKQDIRGEPIEIEFNARWTNYKLPLDEGKTNFAPLFSYRDIQRIKGLEKWLTVATKYQLPLGVVMSTRAAKSIFVSDALGNRAGALESFDRIMFNRNTNKSDLVQVLNRLANLVRPEFSKIVHEKRISRWAKAVREERDDAAHHLGRSELDERAHRQYYLSESLYWLFVLCMLKKADLLDLVFPKLSMRTEFLWLRSRLARII